MQLTQVRARTSSSAVKSCSINLHVLDMYLRTVLIDFDTLIDANPRGTPFRSEPRKWLGSDTLVLAFCLHRGSFERVNLNGEMAGGGRGLEGVGIRLRRCRPAGAWQSGRRRLSYILNTAISDGGTKRNLVAVIPRWHRMLYLKSLSAAV